MSLCREAEEGGNFCKFCLKGGISLQFLCEYAGGVDVCAFVAYLFVRVTQQGEATSTEVEPGGVLRAVCRVEIQFALAAQRHHIGRCFLISDGLYWKPAKRFPQGDDVYGFGVEFVNECADFGELAGFIDADGLAGGDESLFI